jgi:hypothetical protein
VPANGRLINPGYILKVLRLLVAYSLTISFVITHSFQTLTYCSTFSAPQMRPLLLHVSALSDAEYAFYTTALTDLAPCGDSRDSNVDYGSLVVGIREARAWLHGRFSGLPVTDIDSVSL